MNRKLVLLLGASSQIGIFAIPRLLAAGFDVIAVSRNLRPAWYPQFDRVHWKSPDALDALVLSGAKMLISAGPLRIAISVLEQCPDLERAVVFSTSSVFSKINSRDHHEKRQIQQIVLDEAAISDTCRAPGIRLSLFRPTMIYGCGTDGNVSRLANWIRKFGFMPVAGEAPGLRQPVHAEDLAGAAAAALTSAAPLALDVPLCGGSTLSFREMVEAIFHGLNKPVRIISVPRGLLIAATGLGRLIPGFRGVRPEMVRRQGRDLVFDDSKARELLGFQPRPFAPGPREFSLPDPAHLYRLARLEFTPFQRL